MGQLTTGKAQNTARIRYLNSTMRKWQSHEVAFTSILRCMGSFHNSNENAVVRPSAPKRGPKPIFAELEIMLSEWSS
jgi:hypothetical protein